MKQIISYLIGSIVFGLTLSTWAGEPYRPKVTFLQHMQGTQQLSAHARHALIERIFTTVLGRSYSVAPSDGARSNSIFHEPAMQPGHASAEWKLRYDGEFPKARIVLHGNHEDGMGRRIHIKATQVQRHSGGSPTNGDRFEIIFARNRGPRDPTVRHHSVIKFLTDGTGKIHLLEEVRRMLPHPSFASPTWPGIEKFAEGLGDHKDWQMVGLDHRELRALKPLIQGEAMTVNRGRFDTTGFGALDHVLGLAGVYQD